MTTSFRSGRARCLQLQRAGQGDVAVEMALVKFIEENRGDIRATADPGSVVAAEFPRSRNECAFPSEVTFSKRIW